MEKFFNSSLYKRIVTGIIFAFVLFFSFFKFPNLFSYLILSILFIVQALEWPKIANKQNLNLCLLTPIYPVLGFVLIILLNESKFRFLLFYMFVTVFIFDTGSFIFGKLLGKNKLCPKISPGKTWEGFFGGYLSVLTFYIGLFIVKNKSFSILNIFLFPIIISVLALFGDLFESYLKRKAHIKDSGILLPGHGGFLDRFDSILFVVYFFFVFKNQLVNLLY